MDAKHLHITSAIDFSELVRTTLGPRGMNKMVIDEVNNKIILTNDGATIVNSLKGGNPIVELFKNLAHSQESAIGDGTTTSVILAGQLLSNALNLLNKNIHPTIIINGYNLAKIESIKFVNSIKEKGDKQNIMLTAFGTKLPKDTTDLLITELNKVKDFENLKMFTIDNSDPTKTNLFKGHAFEGFTLNDRMDSEVKGKIAVLDFPVNLKYDNFHITSASELENAQNADTNYKRKIVDALVANDVKCVFYTDTTPEFESYLTEKKITGIVVYSRENVDGICNSVKAIAASNVDQINEKHLGFGHVKYVKGLKGIIYVDGDVETLILHGPTTQVLEEMYRAVLDVIGIMRHNLDMVIGAGAIEIELANYLRTIAEKVGGKERLAVEKFAESIESIPSIIAENAGLDSIEILTALKTLHAQGQKDLGVDIFTSISDARVRKVFEPALVKIHAISSASDVAMLILKLDGIYQGDLNKK